jgi:hypothetical protein
LAKRQKTESMRLEELLEKVEWLKITHRGDIQFICPCCGAKYYIGQHSQHTETCELYTFLVALRAGVFQVVLRT